jgi:hypothetical protein
MSKTINFNNKDYSLVDLRKLSVDELVTLRNLVATSLGVASVKTFKDHDTAVDGTWKALEKFDEKMTQEEEETKGKAKKAKAKAEKKPRGLPKSSLPQVVKRPTRKMFSTIQKTGEHDGSQQRADRWKNYKDGMTIVDIKEGEGTEPWDIYNWEKHGIMKIVPPTDSEFEERKNAWYKKHGRQTPEEIKKEKDEVKAKRQAEREAAKVAKAEEKAKKEAAKTAKKEAPKVEAAA